MARGGRGMAVHVPGEGITVGLGMPGRPRYGQRDGREWLCRYLEEGSLQEEGGAGGVVAGGIGWLCRYLDRQDQMFGQEDIPGGN